MPAVPALNVLAGVLAARRAWGCIRTTPFLDILFGLDVFCAGEQATGRDIEVEEASVVAAAIKGCCSVIETERIEEILVQLCQPHGRAQCNSM